MAEEIITEKACSKCKERKPLIKFSKKAKAKDGRKSQCRQCVNEAYAYLSDKDYIRRQSIWNKYGLTPERFAEMVIEQKGLCAICHRPPKGKRLCVDHCHVTGRIRGLLCDACNHGLGHFEDSAERMERAIEYLKSVEGEPQPTRGRFANIVPPHNRHKRGDDHPFRNGKQLKGEAHGMAIFNEEQVKEFRRRYDSGEITSTDLAKEQGIPKTTMQAITSRRNWKHVE